MHGPDAAIRYALLIALPLTRARFVADAADPRKDFVRQWAASFPGYPPDRLWDDYKPLAAYALRIADEARRASVRVAVDARFSSWTDAAHTSDVITLVAHWVSGAQPALEFSDGIRPLDTIVAALPGDFGGVIDLTVCHSTRAIAAFKARRPRATVLANREAAAPDVRLAMYRQVLHLVHCEGAGYVDAAERVHVAALERI
jgi:hypothetical protein